MDHASEEYRQAIALIKSGKKAAARNILLRVLRQNPVNEMAWLWLVETLDSDTQRVEALRHCLKYNPDSQRARKALQYLESKMVPVKYSTPVAEQVKQEQAEGEALFKKPIVQVLIIAIIALVVVGGLAVLWFGYLQPSGIVANLFSAKSPTQVIVLGTATPSPTETITVTPSPTFTPTITSTATPTPLPTLSLKAFPSLQVAFLKENNLDWMDNQGNDEVLLEGVSNPLVSTEGKILYTSLDDESAQRWTTSEEDSTPLAVFNPAQLVPQAGGTWTDCSQNYAESWQPENFVAVQCGYTVRDTYSILTVSYDASAGKERCRIAVSLLEPMTGVFSPDGKFVATRNGERFLLINAETCRPLDELDPLSPLTSSGYYPTESIVYLDRTANVLYRYVESILNKKVAVLQVNLADGAREILMPEANQDLASIFDPEETLPLQILNTYTWGSDAVFLHLADEQTGDTYLYAVSLQEGGAQGWVNIPEGYSFPGVESLILSPDGKMMLVSGPEDTLSVWDWQQPEAEPQALIDGTLDILAWSADSKYILIQDDTALIAVDLKGETSNLFENPGELVQPVVGIENGGFFYRFVQSGIPQVYLLKAGYQPFSLDSLSSSDVTWIQPVVLP